MGMVRCGTLSLPCSTSISLVGGHLIFRQVISHVRFLDTTGCDFSFLMHRDTFLTVLNSTLYSMAKFAGLRDPVTLDFEGSTLAYCVDAMAITVGSLLGTSPVTAYIESATGIAGAYWSGWPLFLLGADMRRSRGWQDRYHGHCDRSDVLCLCLLCPDLCLHPIVGYGWRPRHRGVFDDQKVGRCSLSFDFHRELGQVC